MGKNVKALIFLGGCNFRKGKYLRFCRASNSQCGGRGFESLLLHQTHSSALFSRVLCDQSFTAQHPYAIQKFTFDLPHSFFRGPCGRRVRDPEVRSLTHEEFSISFANCAWILRRVGDLGLTDQLQSSAAFDMFSTVLPPASSCGCETVFGKTQLVK